MIYLEVNRSSPMRNFIFWVAVGITVSVGAPIVARKVGLSG